MKQQNDARHHLENNDTKPSEMSWISTASHLIPEGTGELNELEFGIMIVSHAFQRWIVRCMAAAGVRDLSHLDVVVLHSVHHRGRAKRINDICFVLNVEDTHTVSYALRKLSKMGLVHGERRGKETFFTPTEQGKHVCEEYRKVRERCLLSSVSLLNEPTMDIRDTAKFLRALSGIYDQAARAATSL